MIAATAAANSKKRLTRGSALRARLGHACVSERGAQRGHHVRYAFWT